LKNNLRIYHNILFIIMEQQSESIVEDIINEEKIEPSKEELETFKNLVNDWFKYDDQIRKLQIAMKERKNYQRVLNNKIEQFMFNYKYNDLNTQHGRIKTNVKECKVPIKMNDIKTKIMQYNNLSGEELLKRIFEEDRTTVVKKNIRRVIPKVSLTI
tara:strand:+ start:832 stop:1302 length:471 start_codon:yes stop_codon:yes gene_type:complete